VALEYETEAQAQKALCQQGCRRMGPDVFIGCCPLTVELVQSLRYWRSDAITTPSSRDSTWRPAIRSSSATANQMVLREEDILLTNRDSRRMVDGARKSFCQVVVEFLFGWN
jgi:hypothetical protein